MYGSEEWINRLEDRLRKSLGRKTKNVFLKKQENTEERSSGTNIQIIKSQEDVCRNIGD